MSLVLLRWVTLRRAENANEAESLAPTNGVCLNLALVASTRLLVELYMLITSIRFLTRSLGTRRRLLRLLKIQVGSVAASSADRWLARTDVAGHQRGVRFVRLRPGQWEGPALFKLALLLLVEVYQLPGHWEGPALFKHALLLLVEVYQLSGHRIAAEPGSKIVLVTPTRRGMPISLRPWVSVMPPQPRSMEAKLGEQPLWGRHCQPLKRASLTCRRPAADAQTLFEHLRDHQWELGAFIDLHTATVCAGSTGAVDILVVEPGQVH
eukprot:s8179_g1.t1